MIWRWFQQEWIAASLIAIVAVTVATHGRSAEPRAVALTASLDAPARLVLDYWPSGGWLVTQNDRQIELVLPGVLLAISFESVLLPAGDGAISTLAAGTEGSASFLRIGLGCDCTLALQGDSNHLFIDVVASGRVAGPLFMDADTAPRLAPAPRPRHVEGGIKSSATDDQRVAETRTRLIDELRRAADVGLVTMRSGADGGLAEAIKQSRGEDAPAPDDAAGPEVTAPVTDTAGDMSADVAAEFHPAEPVAVHATPDATALRGAAEPGAAANPYAPPETAPEIDGVAEIRPEVEITRPDSDVPNPAVERGHSGPAAPAQVAPAQVARIDPLDLTAAPPAPACFGNEAFQLIDPLSPGALAAEISGLRRALVGEFDRVDTAAALLLARLYLAHGLGTEALDVLTVFVPEDPETSLLAALARLTEGRPLPVTNVLSVAGCTGQHALWQALDAALAERPGAAVAYEAAASGALEQTARGVRGQIAVRLGLAAMAGGGLNAAYRLNAMAKRAVAVDDHESGELRLLLEAKLRLARGDTQAALAGLSRLLGARSPAGAAALLMLAELADFPANGVAVQPDQLRLDLGALALEQRDTALGGQAFLKEAALTGRHIGRDAAFDLLAFGYAGRILDDDAYRDALAALGASLLELSDDTPLALVYEADPHRFARAIEDAEFRMTLARSYFDLGAPVLGEAVLRRDDLESAALVAGLARSHLEIGNADAADRFAAMLPEGQSRAAIDAGVALARGDAPGALARLAAAGAPVAQRARTAWAAGDWPASVLALVESITAVDAKPAKPSTANGIESGAAGGDRLTADMATRLALAARNAGSSAAPPEALSLAEGEPDLAAGLRAIFARPMEGLAGRSPAAIATFLEALSAEERLFEEILNDG